ncbi:MAG TPA: N,N-dimethylformamidase beta subunit family domain-containing protein [Planctomycetota bacterium]
MRRRDLLKGGVALALGGCAVTPAKRDAVRAENQRPGTTDWRLTKTRVDAKEKFRSPAIEGYVSKTSVRAGEALDVFVSTNPASSFRLDLYRMGYYGGAGGRQVAALGPFKGEPQPDPEMGEERLRACRWASTTRLTIPGDWLSGVYLGKLTEEREGLHSYVIFVVRDDRRCDLLLQVSDTTWAAYNRWPNAGSIYDDGKKAWYWGPNVRVGFDRPYGRYCQIEDWPLSQGSGEFLLWEFPLVHWLEREGYDVSYISNLDTHFDGPGLLRAKGWLSTGHDEYWSREMFENARSAVAAGLNIAFLSSDSVLGLIDIRPDRAFSRIGVFGDIDPAEPTTFAEMKLFKPCGLDEGLLMGNRTIDPVIGLTDWICSNEKHWIFDGTGMKNGDGISGLVGWEWQGNPAKLPGLEVVAKGPVTWSGRTAEYAATIYPGPKGNHVFSCSTIWWADGLSAPPGYRRPKTYGGKPTNLKGPDPRVEKITANLLRRFIGA